MVTCEYSVRVASYKGLHSGDMTVLSESGQSCGGLHSGHMTVLSESSQRKALIIVSNGLALPIQESNYNCGDDSKQSLHTWAIPVLIRFGNINDRLDHSLQTLTVATFDCHLSYFRKAYSKKCYQMKAESLEYMMVFFVY